jgi:SP family galactose:H+ symporter-like MFS transporter
LFIGRFVVGAAFGAASFTGPLYLSEAAPRDRRGQLVSVFTLGLMVGVLVAYLVRFALAAAGHWRWMLALGAVSGLLLCLGGLLLSETPHWVMYRGDEEAARRALARIRGGQVVEQEPETPSGRASAATPPLWAISGTHSCARRWFSASAWRSSARPLASSSRPSMPPSSAWGPASLRPARVSSRRSRSA